MASSPAAPIFTPEMRDRQARGRDPYDSNSDDGDWVTEPVGIRTGSATSTSAGYSNALAGTLPPRVCGPKKDEPFAVYDRRRMAAHVLDSQELLMMAALRDNESLAATRLKYSRLLCGVDEPGAAFAAAETTTSPPSPTQQLPDQQPAELPEEKQEEKQQSPQPQPQQQIKRSQGRGGTR